MASRANDTLPVLALLAPASPATFARAQLLAGACILTTGRRTITNLLCLVGHLTQGTPSNYPRPVPGQVVRVAPGPPCRHVALNRSPVDGFFCVVGVPMAESWLTTDA